MQQPMTDSESFEKAGEHSVVAAVVAIAVPPADRVLLASSVSCLAGCSSMGDEQVAELCPLWSGEKSHQVAFDLLDGLRGRQRESCRDSGYMCIDDDAEVDPECIAQNHIGGLSGDTPEFE